VKKGVPHTSRGEMETGLEESLEKNQGRRDILPEKNTSSETGYNREESVKRPNLGGGPSPDEGPQACEKENIT